MTRRVRIGRLSGRTVGVLLGAAALVLVFASAGVRAHAAPGIGEPGAKIAFTRLCEIAGCPDIVEHQQAEIWVMNGDGSDPRQLTHNTTWDLAAVWSPDGKTVAFYGTQFDPTTDQQLGFPHIYLINADGTDQRLLTDQPGRFPAFSPDGDKIAFDSGGQTSANVFVINSDGTGLTQITHEPAARNIRPAWSPDGDKLAFTSRRDGVDHIYVMNADGSDPTRLTDTSNADNAAAWSPDGDKILFERNLGPAAGQQDIFEMNADGSGQATDLSDNYPGRDEDPDWSPSGRKIAFERDLGPADGVNFSDKILEVFVMNADGGNATPLTGLPTENGHPGWGRGPALVP
jgi:Tol biopolymer transport system component